MMDGLTPRRDADGRRVYSDGSRRLVIDVAPGGYPVVVSLYRAKN